MRLSVDSTLLFQRFSRPGQSLTGDHLRQSFWALTVGTDFRGDAHPLVNGFSNPEFHGFETLAEAEDYMDSEGVTFYQYQIKYGAGNTSPTKGEKAYYAVANGRTPGIQELY